MFLVKSLLTHRVLHLVCFETLRTQKIPAHGNSAVLFAFPADCASVQDIRARKEQLLPRVAPGTIEYRYECSAPAALSTYALGYML